MDYLQTVKNNIVNYAEARIAEIQRNKEEQIRKKQAEYRAQVTDKELAKLEELRVKAVNEVNTTTEKRKKEIIDADNLYVCETESVVYEKEIETIRKALELLKENETK